MAIQNITYTNKVDLNETAVADINKVKASDLNEIKSAVNNNASELSYLEGTTLWTNSSPTASFSAQTISLSESIDSYYYYEILFRQSTADARIMTTGKIPVGYGTILLWYATTSFYRPTDTTVNGNTITFFDCKNTSGTTDNERTIPYKVIAYKR